MDSDYRWMAAGDSVAAEVMDRLLDKLIENADLRAEYCRTFAAARGEELMTDTEALAALEAFRSRREAGWMQTLTLGPATTAHDAAATYQNALAELERLDKLRRSQ